MSEVTIAFLGAAETVTGSRFLVSDGDKRILIDCGMFQGESEIADKNKESFRIDEGSIDAILLTHAHLDHCGYIPALVKNGFAGAIFSTKYTAKVAEVVLYDSAHIQMQNFSDNPLYAQKDVISAMNLFRVIEIRHRIEILPGIFATFYPSGHILGSTFVTLEIGGKRLLFTGDLGRGNHPLLAGPDAPPPGIFNAVVTESTYGDREHTTPIAAFGDAINEALARGGSILIPAFAVDRTEEILFELRRLFDARIVKSLPVFVDSPMAEKVLAFYNEAIVNKSIDIKPEVAEEFTGSNPLDPGKLRIMTTVDESKLLNDIEEQSIIISASGMATGGRVTYHLASMLPDPKNTVVLVGFQARGSRGLLLQQGAKELRIHGGVVKVNATIADVEGFSVHADGKELIGWLKQIDHPAEIFVVHGERESQEAMKSRIESELGVNATIPEITKAYIVK